MRNEQEYNDRERRDQHRRHEQNASDRWGRPDPRMLGPDDAYRNREDNRRIERNIRDNRRPFEQRDNRHFQQDDRRYNNYRNERPEWQQDQHFNQGNQHADDRWREDRGRPQQHHHPRHASERFYREQRRRDY